MLGDVPSQGHLLPFPVADGAELLTHLLIAGLPAPGCGAAVWRDGAVLRGERAVYPALADSGSPAGPLVPGLGGSWSSCTELRLERYNG